MSLTFWHNSKQTILFATFSMPYSYYKYWLFSQESPYKSTIKILFNCHECVLWLYYTAIKMKKNNNPSSASLFFFLLFTENYLFLYVIGLNLNSNDRKKRKTKYSEFVDSCIGRTLYLQCEWSLKSLCSVFTIPKYY